MNDRLATVLNFVVNAAVVAEIGAMFCKIPSRGDTPPAALRDTLPRLRRGGGRKLITAAHRELTIAGKTWWRQARGVLARITPPAPGGCSSCRGERVRLSV
jgi:hypothetical protein